MTTQEIFDSLFFYAKNDSYKVGVHINPREIQKGMYKAGANFIVTVDAVTEISKEEARAAMKNRDRVNPSKVLIQCGNEGVTGMEIWAI